MPFPFLKDVAADVDLSESVYCISDYIRVVELTGVLCGFSEAYVKNEKERFIPFSVNPFREPQAQGRNRDSEGEEKGEPATEWQELVRAYSLPKSPCIYDSVKSTC